MPSCRWWTPPGIGIPARFSHTINVTPGESKRIRLLVLNRAPTLLIRSTCWSSGYHKSNLVRRFPAGKYLVSLTEASNNGDLPDKRGILSRQTAPNSSPIVEEDDYFWTLSRSFAFVGLLCAATLISLNDAVKAVVQVKPRQYKHADTANGTIQGNHGVQDHVQHSGALLALALLDGRKHGVPSTASIQQIPPAVLTGVLQSVKDSNAQLVACPIECASSDVSNVCDSTFSNLLPAQQRISTDVLENRDDACSSRHPVKAEVGIVLSPSGNTPPNLCPDASGQGAADTKPLQKVAQEPQQNDLWPRVVLTKLPAKVKAWMVATLLPRARQASVSPASSSAFPSGLSPPESIREDLPFVFARREPLPKAAMACQSQGPSLKDPKIQDSSSKKKKSSWWSIFLQRKSSQTPVVVRSKRALGQEAVVLFEERKPTAQLARKRLANLGLGFQSSKGTHYSKTSDPDPKKSLNVLNVCPNDCQTPTTFNGPDRGSIAAGSKQGSTVPQGLPSEYHADPVPALQIPPPLIPSPPSQSFTVLCDGAGPGDKPLLLSTPTTAGHPGVTEGTVRLRHSSPPRRTADTTVTTTCSLGIAERTPTTWFSAVSPGPPKSRTLLLQAPAPKQLLNLPLTSCGLENWQTSTHTARFPNHVPGIMESAPCPRHHYNNAIVPGRFSDYHSSQKPPLPATLLGGAPLRRSLAFKSGVGGKSLQFGGSRVSALGMSVRPVSSARVPRPSATKAATQILPMSGTHSQASPSPWLSPANLFKFVQPSPESTASWPSCNTGPIDIHSASDLISGNGSDMFCCGNNLSREATCGTERTVIIRQQTPQLDPYTAPGGGAYTLLREYHPDLPLCIAAISIDPCTMACNHGCRVAHLGLPLLRSAGTILPAAIPITDIAPFPPSKTAYNRLSSVRSSNGPKRTMTTNQAPSCLLAPSAFAAPVQSPSWSSSQAVSSGSACKLDIAHPASQSHVEPRACGLLVTWVRGPHQWGHLRCAAANVGTGSSYVLGKGLSTITLHTQQVSGPCDSPTLASIARDTHGMSVPTATPSPGESKPAEVHTAHAREQKQGARLSTKRTEALTEAPGSTGDGTHAKERRLRSMLQSMSPPTPRGRAGFCTMSKGTRTWGCILGGPYAAVAGHMDGPQFDDPVPPGGGGSSSDFGGGHGGGSGKGGSHEGSGGSNPSWSESLLELALLLFALIVLLGFQVLCPQGKYVLPMLGVLPSPGTQMPFGRQPTSGGKGFPESLRPLYSQGLVVTASQHSNCWGRK